MPKAYLILHDGKYVLLGEGGKSGRPPVERGGYHLPGGKIEQNETAQKAVIRELAEETGIALQNHQVENDNITPDKVNGAVFVVIKVADVPALVGSFVRPRVANVYDEPYTALLSLESKDSWNNNNFSAQYNTDYFSIGLLAAKAYIAPK